jgi:UDP-N-acetylglucosamine--N-acetylmuramyl-(pentapeptide) pyrophosphoryl-undecaprenol N-acetylglucosamine transferase
MRCSELKVLFSGGGTAGHINPAIAVAKHFRQMEKKTEILFVGTQRGMEVELVPREGFDLKLIKVRGLKRKLSFELVLAVKEFIQGMVEAGKIIREFKPDIVIGTGGYVCGPVVLIAAMMNIPTVIHEQNAFPGLTNRLLSRFADITAISFGESRKFFKAAKRIEYTGNPVRKELLAVDRGEARKNLGIKDQDRLVVIFGGSLGAKKINDSVVDMVCRYHKEIRFKIIFGTGKKQYDEVLNRLKSCKPPSVEVVPYIYDMASVMRAADLVVCRAGAITVSELTALGVPSILIPSPYVTANHQEYNARALEREGAASVLLENDLSGLVLYRMLTELLENSPRLVSMSKAASRMGVTNAAEKLYSLSMELVKTV